MLTRSGIARCGEHLSAGECAGRIRSTHILHPPLLFCSRQIGGDYIDRELPSEKQYTDQSLLETDSDIIARKPVGTPLQSVMRLRCWRIVMIGSSSSQPVRADVGLRSENAYYTLIDQGAAKPRTRSILRSQRSLLPHTRKLSPWRSNCHNRACAVYRA